MVRIVYFSFLILTSVQINAQSPVSTKFEQNFSKELLLQDFEVLQAGLAKLHPGFYRYASKDFIDSVFLQAKKEIPNTMSYAEFYRVICTAIAEIRCQHTVAAPNSETLNRIRKEGLVFPLKLYWEFNPLSAYAAYDFSSEASLPPGTRIIAINGQKVKDIYSYLIPFFPSDGDVVSNKQSRLQYGADFQLWYYLLIDRPENYVVELESSDGVVFTKTYAAVTFRQLKKNYKKFISQKDPKLRRYIDYWVAKNRSKPIRYEFLSDSVALLTVRNFHSPQLKKIVSRAFAEINEKATENVIIDVRYNGGGSDILGRYLFTHLIDKPVAYFDSLYTAAGISDTTFLYTYTDKNAEWYKNNLPLVDKMPDGRFATKPEVNEGLQIQQPAKYNFKGNVYILMNGRSASTTAEFTAAIHINKLATFIGEESGGAYHGGNGGDFANLKLPNSEIEVTIPLAKYVMNSEETRYIGQGTLPDFKVHTTMQDILDLKDPQLLFALDLIEKRK